MKTMQRQPEMLKRYLRIIQPNICHPLSIQGDSNKLLQYKQWPVTVVLFGMNVFYPCHRDLVQPCSATSSTATATWTTCRVCASSTSYTRRWSRRWRRCSSTTCRGSRCSSWRRPWMCCASVAPRSCSPTSLPSTSKRTTSPSFSRWGGIKVIFFSAQPHVVVFYSCKNNDYFWTGFQNSPTVCCWWD